MSAGATYLAFTDIGEVVTDILRRASSRARLPRITWPIAARWELIGYGSLLLTAGAMRLWDLGYRAMHHDESLHATYAWYLANGQGYIHNPMMHGPFQMEATAGAFLLFGDSDFTARLVYAVAGTVLVGLPFLFRHRLGNLGAIFVSALLAFSPTMLYFSRFARNDILIAVWTLGLVVCMWRYVDEGRNRYLYVASALLALAFATKETAYIVTATLGLYLVLVVLSRNWASVRAGVTMGEVSPPVALLRIVGGLWTTTFRSLSTSGLSREASFLLVLITLTLPQWTGIISLLQDVPPLSGLGLVLASPLGGDAPIGAPVRGGLVVAALAVLAVLWLSVAVGFRWNRSVWWKCAVVFYTVWVLLYSTFFTHPGGVGSGVWQGLAYWLVQQGEARGGQPWYYYIMISSVYEFLPLLFTVIGGVYYLRRPHRFGRFLVFWAATTWVLYTVASEKMPWLMVNVSLPLIVLAGTFLGDVVRGIRWRPLVAGGGLFALAAVPLVVVALWQLAFASMDDDGGADILASALSLAAIVAVGGFGYLVARRVGYSSLASIALVPVALLLLALGVRAGWNASYRNGDVPVEMIVYTQTSPDIARLARYLQEAGDDAEGGADISIDIDGTSGFTWPWAWYLRDNGRVGWPSLADVPLQAAPDSSVLLIHDSNLAEAEPLLDDRFEGGTRIKHRWWFPESYKGLTVGQFMRALFDRKAWRTAMDYFLYRELSTPLGSEDAFLYFSKDFPSDFTPFNKVE